MGLLSVETPPLISFLPDCQMARKGNQHEGQCHKQILVFKVSLLAFQMHFVMNFGIYDTKKVAVKMPKSVLKITKVGVLK